MIDENYPEALHGMPHGAVIPELTQVVAAQTKIFPNRGNESGFEMKQSTMPDAPDTIETIFAGVRPTYVVPEGTTDDTFPHEILATKTLVEASTE